MKKFILILGLALLPLVTSAQNYFDSLEDQEDVTSFVATKKMFEMMGKIDVSADDPEAQKYLDLISGIDNLKVFATKKGETAAKMQKMMMQYLKKANLQELMRVKDEGTNVKFYMREGSNSDKVAELLMFVKGTDINVNGGKIETVLLTLTGDFDLKQVSNLTREFDIPGGEHLKKAEKRN